MILNRKVFAWLSITVALLSGAALTWMQLSSDRFNLDDFTGILFVSGIVVVGSLILTHQPQNRLGLLFSLVGVLWAVSNALLSYANYSISNSINPDAFVPWIALIGSWFSDLAWVTSVTYLFLLLPDGRLPSLRWRLVAWLVAGVIFVGLTLNLVTPGPLSQLPSIDNPLGIAGLAAIVEIVNQTEVVFILSVLMCLLSVFVRYRSASMHVKQQIKWIAYLGVALALLFIVQNLVSVFWSGTLLEAVLNASGGLIFACFPLLIGIAILRFRLFDIDLIIRRTLVYSSVTILLAAVFYGGVTLLQGAFTSISGQHSTIAIVLSTLGIAALFNPLRLRTQGFVDRRFYRKKYNADQTLARFMVAARNEVETRKLADTLLNVVGETMEPEDIRLWLQKDTE